MAVFTTEQLRNIDIGQTITAKASGSEIFTVRTLVNRLKMVDEYAAKGLDISVHYDSNTGSVSVSKTRVNEAV
jgi:hypothetical protein